MTTALSMIDRAFELIGYKDPGETLSGADSYAGLNALNSMVDAWQQNTLFVYATTYVTQTVSGDPITIGAGGTINVNRPVEIPSGGFVRVGGLDYGFSIIDRDAWANITLKSLNTPWPSFCYYEPALPLGKLYFYPQIGTSTELHLPVRQQVAQFADLTTDYTLDVGYKIAIEYSLAEELAIGRVQLDPRISAKGMQYRNNIQRAEIPMLSNEATMVGKSNMTAGIAAFNAGWMG